MIGLLILVISALGHARRLPYIASRLSHLELLSLLNSGLTYFLGQFTIDAGSFGESFQEAASVLALLSNLGFLLIACWVGLPLYVACTQRIIKKRSKATKASRPSVESSDRVVAQLDSVENLDRGSGHDHIELVLLPATACRSAGGDSLESNSGQLHLKPVANGPC